MPNKKVPPCEQYGNNFVVYTRGNEKLCRRKKQKREDLILQRLDTIIELLRVRGPMAPPPPPPPPPSRSNANRPLKRKSPPRKADPMMMARASLMNNLKKALVKRKKE